MRLLETVRIIIASYEALFFVVVVAVYFYFPSVFVGIGNHFKTNNDIWKFIPSVPLIICGFSVQYAWKILMPLEGSSNRILHEWPNYWKLKYRVIISVILCAVCVICTISIWIFSTSLSALTVGTIFMSSIIISLTVAFNQFLAAFKVRELMEP